MDAIQVLYIPTGEYIVSKNRDNVSVLFDTVESAEKMVSTIVKHRPYVCGAPLTDFSVGSLPITEPFEPEEFEYIPVHTSTFYPPPLILELA